MHVAVGESRVRMMSSRSSTAFLLIVVLAAGRAAHGQNIAILGVSRFEARISNYWQLDCLSGKAPDFSEKDPLWSFIRTSDPRSESKSPLPVPKTHPTFQLHAHEACSVVAICVCNPGRSPLGINRRMIRFADKGRACHFDSNRHNNTNTKANSHVHAHGNPITIAIANRYGYTENK